MQMYKMLRLNLPPFETKIIERENTPYIYDILRHKYIALTPEEWVRQHFIHFLTEHKGYPAALIGNEISLNLNGARRRCDSVLYSQTMRPRMIMEYKAPNIAITQKVFTQIYSYNIVLNVDYLVVSNGLTHYCCKVNYKTRSYTFLRDIPEYKSL